MRDHRHPEGLAPALQAAYATSTATPGSTARATDAPPQRRRSREELAAAQQRAQSRVQGQVQKQKDQERRARMRQAQQRREQSPAERLFVPYRMAAVFVALLVFVFGGALFEVARGEHFLVTGHATLRAATPWLVLAAAPLWYWALCRTEVLAPWWVQQMPTWFVRQMVAYPFAALLGAAAVGPPPGAGLPTWASWWASPRVWRRVWCRWRHHALPAAATSTPAWSFAAARAACA